MPEAVRTKRTILQAKIETTPGTLESSWAAATESMPIYEAFNVFQAEIETINVTRARGTLDRSETMVGIASSRFAGNIYVFGSGNASAGYANVAALPVWARTLLQAAGFTAEDDEMTHGFLAGEILFSPVSEAHKSVSFRTWLDKFRHDSAGARGNIVFSAEAGNPVIGAFDFLGSYIKADNAMGSGMADVVTDPGLPPKWCGVNSFRLKSERSGSALITPNVKSFNLDLGTQVAIRRDANEADCITEVGIFQEFQSSLQVVIEVQDYSADLGSGTDVEEFIEAMNQGDKFAFELRVGPYTATTGEGEQFIFFNHDGVTTNVPTIDTTTVYQAQLVTAPQYADDNGIRTWTLDFGLNGVSDDFLFILAR